MVLPNLLSIAAVLFLLATATRSLLATLIGVIAFIVLLSIAKLLTQDVNNHALAAILDPFGGRTLQIVTRYWAPEQINRQLPPLAGLLLFNRLLWSGVAGGSVGGHREGLVVGVLGAVAGAALGNAVERGVTKEQAVEILLQLRNGERRAIVQAQGNENWIAGEPVIVVTTGGKSRVVRAPATTRTN